MQEVSQRVLAVNAGSSSIKFAVFEAADSPRRILDGHIERIGTPDARIVTRGAEPGEQRSGSTIGSDRNAAVGALVDWIGAWRGGRSLRAFGHRIVHGGPVYGAPERIDAPMLESLRKLTPFDPQHLPRQIALIEAIQARFPELPNIACFDTAFHQHLPRVAQLLPIPRRYHAQGVRRYGFHGLSYEYLMEQLRRVAGAAAADGRVILAHLGSGASLCAVLHGAAVDTSMSFTPAAGVPMGTRSGDLDPGLLWYLSKSEGMTAEQYNDMINLQSGLLGVSETSSDMQELLLARANDVRAEEAVALFCYQVKKFIGAYSAALGGIDTLVFSGGIGERAAEVRSRICEGLEFLGVGVDFQRNQNSAGVISVDGAAATVRVIPTDEEWVIAKATCRILKLPSERDHDGTSRN